MGGDEVKALLVEWSYIGDALMASPVPKALKSKYEYVDVVCYEDCAEVWEANPYVNYIYRTDRHWTSRAKTMNNARFHGYDLVLQTRTSLATNILMRRIGCPTLGYNCKWKGLPLSIKIPIMQKASTVGNRVDECLDLLKAIGIEATDREMIFNLKKRERVSPKFVALHANTRNTQALRRWPGFASLASVLRRVGYRIFWIGTKDDAPYIRSIDPNGDIANTPDLQSLGSFLTRCKFFVCVNSAPMHLARALNVPTLALIGGTPASVVCNPTENFQFIEGEGLDMNRIKVGDVLNKLARWM